MGGWFRLMLIPPTEPPKPFVLSYGKPPPRNDAPIVLWKFGFVSGVATFLLITSLATIEELISHHENIVAGCCSGVLAGLIVAAVGFVVGSSAHGLARYALGARARSRSSTTHSLTGLLYAAASVGAVYLMMQLDLPRFYGFYNLIVGVSPVVLFAAVAGCFLAGCFKRAP
jgi:hypothetical protein